MFQGTGQAKRLPVLRLKMSWVPLLIRSDVQMHVYKHSVAAGNIYYNSGVTCAILFMDSDKSYQSW